mgnify:CR=1 FL=1
MSFDADGNWIDDAPGAPVSIAVARSLLSNLEYPSVQTPERLAAYETKKKSLTEQLALAEDYWSAASVAERRGRAEAQQAIDEKAASDEANLGEARSGYGDFIAQAGTQGQAALDLLRSKAASFGGDAEAALNAAIGRHQTGYDEYFGRTEQGAPGEEGYLAAIQGYAPAMREMIGSQYSGMTDQMAADIQSRYANASTQGMQDLTSRGLAGTTVGTDLQRAYQQEGIAETTRQATALEQQRAGALSQFDMANLQYAQAFGAREADLAAGFGMEGLQGAQGYQLPIAELMAQQDQAAQDARQGYLTFQERITDEIPAWNQYLGQMSLAGASGG